MAHGLEHVPVRVEPEDCLVAGVVVRGLAGLVQHFAVESDDRAMDLVHKGATPHDDGQVLQSCSVPRAVTLIKAGIEEEVRADLALDRLVRELVAGEKKSSYPSSGTIWS